MRQFLLTLLAGAAAFSHVQAANKDAKPVDVDDESTTFNSIEVPPLLVLTPTNWDEEIGKTKFLMIKHYSPYCSHCIEFAPTFQTLYEYYYTSKTASPDGASFLEYHDFRFGTVNCIAFYDLCARLGVTAFPTSTIYQDGEALEAVHGGKDMATLSEKVEKVLEAAKPGSRPASVNLPQPGALRSPDEISAQEPVIEVLEEKAETDEDPEPEAAPAVGAAKLPSKQKTETTVDKDHTVKDGKTTTGSKVEGRESPYLVAMDSWKVPTPAEQFRAMKPKTPTTTPNPQGVSTSLSAESFQRLVTMTQDPWFVKFYAPWCPHCKSMAPAWEQMAKNMQGKLNIGEVNCDNEHRLCKDVHANGYPTILFFKGGERSEYQGLRGLGDFVQYAENALDLIHGVPDVTAEEFEELEQTEDVIFVYFYDHATATEDFQAIERLPLSLIGHAKLVKTNDPKMFERFKITTWPRLLVSREGRPTYFTPLTPYEMRDIRLVLEWMSSVWLPLVPELTAMNARQITDGKLIVLGVLNRDSSESFKGALRELKSAASEWMDRQIQEFQLERKKLRDAKQMRIEEAEDRDDQRALRAAKAIRINMDQSGRKEVGFAWVDGVFWQRWIRTTYGVDVKDGERVIVNDQDGHMYWDTSVTGNYILVSRTAIMETLDKIVYGPQGNLKPKLTVSLVEKVLYDIRRNFVDHPYLSGGCVFGVLFGVVSWYRSRRRGRGGHFNLDDSLGIRELKDGLLGQNGNQKAD